MNPTILDLEAANIELDQLSKNALKVVERLQEKGYQALLVGGCVRDLMLGRIPKDFDVCTNATPEQVKRVFNRNGRIIGRRFKIVHVRFGYEVIEVATFRAGADDRDSVAHHEMNESDEGQLLRDNVYGTIEEDVNRRDFTVNALYLDPIKGEVIDYLGGIADINAQRLISIGDATTRFREDPVRMLRVVRFAAKLGFEMEHDALDIIENEGRLLSHVSPARLFEEVLKLFHGGAAHKTYLMLREFGLFKYLFPFTDQIALAGDEGLPELALQNTDRRIHEGKPVIPAFLFACMLWDPVKADAQVLMEDGTKEHQAWRVAMHDALRDQNQYVAVPRRLADIILDIWNIHFHLIRRSPRHIKTNLANRRFRAAYDFLLLRTQVHEVDEEIAEWWTQIQTLDKEARNEMISELSARRHEEREDQVSGQEPNGNSIDYQPQVDEYGVPVPSVNKPQQRRQKVHKKRHKKRGQRKTNRRGQGHNPNQQGASAQDGSPPKEGAKRRSKRRSKSHKKRARNRNQDDSQGRFVNARPKDDLGVFSSSDADMKKVKVRRKKKISLDDAPRSNASDKGNSSVF